MNRLTLAFVVLFASLYALAPAVAATHKHTASSASHSAASPAHSSSSGAKTAKGAAPKSSSSKSAKSGSGKKSRSAKSSGHAAKETKKEAAVSAPQPHKLHGQQSMAPARVTAIQQALIREHYLTGEANGDWNEETIAAMRKFQGDQGWQTRLMPDSRALQKLGLGPDYSSAINAKDGNFAAPKAPGTTPPDQAAGFTSASGVKQ